MPSDEVLITQDELKRLKFYESLVCRLWFYLVGIIPDELIEETQQRLAKRSEDVKHRRKNLPERVIIISSTK